MYMLPIILHNVLDCCPAGGTPRTWQRASLSFPAQIRPRSLSHAHVVPATTTHIRQNGGLVRLDKN
eukprot:3155746-Amphidinium_carterae.1